MRIGKYNISSDGKHQFVLQEVKTVTDKESKNFGKETLANPSYHPHWDGVVRKLIKLEQMASVKDFDSINDVTWAFKRAMGKLEEEAHKQLGRKS